MLKNKKSEYLFPTQVSSGTIKDFDSFKQDFIDWIKFEAGNVHGCNIVNILATGQNLSGCVWNSLDYSALSWAKRGHLVQIILSMCGDY